MADLKGNQRKFLMATVKLVAHSLSFLFFLHYLLFLSFSLLLSVF